MARFGLVLAPMLALLWAVTAPARAADADSVAEKQIRLAIDEHYLSTEFDAAKRLLEKTIDECRGRCSRSVEASAWVYLGIVEGAGRLDLDAARRAFQSALELDPHVELDPDLASGDVRQAFEDVKEGLPSSGAASGGDAEVKGDLACSPGPRDVEANSVVPVFCRGRDAISAMELRYKPFGATDFAEIEMKRAPDGFRAELPCDATELAGTLAFYVRAKDAGGEVIDNFGAGKAPVELLVRNERVDDPPTFPGESAPTRCAAEVLCPPDFPGCESDVDSTPREQTSEDEGSDDWLGIQVAQDLLWFSAKNTCSIETQLEADVHCYEYDPASGERDLAYPGYRANGDVGDPYPGTSIAGGFVPATTRLLLTYDRRFIAGLFGGVRLGYAFGGGPTTRDGVDFLPVHAEGRLSYWFGRSGLVPYVQLGGGLAQIDARKEITGIRDCTTVPADPSLANSEQPFLDCIAGDPQYANSLEPFTVDAWKKVGQGFLTLGGGVLFQFTDHLGARFDLAMLLLAPSSGLVLEPSLGLVLGL